MSPTHRILISAPYPKHLSESQRTFLQELTRRVEQRGFLLFDIDKFGRLDAYSDSIRELHGVLVVALAQWEARRTGSKQDDAVLPTEFSHLHIATAIAAGRPLLVLKEKSVSDRGALKPTLGVRVAALPSSLKPSWLDSPDFRKTFDRWADEIEAHKDVFLGYCSESRGTAAEVQLYLERAGLSVRNWAMDFQAGRSILAEIEDARAHCTAGVFLFTEDDPYAGPAGGAAPRDNVVFEAGYFMSAKGQRRCLIVREGIAKIPADLGGAIYVQLQRGSGVETIAAQLGSFAARIRNDA